MGISSLSPDGRSRGLIATVIFTLISLPVASAMLSSCSSDSEEMMAEGVGGSINAAGGGTVTGAGGAPECTEDSQCGEPSENGCVVPRCTEAGTCETVNADAGTACAFELGTVCDGQGSCIGCRDGGDCFSGVCLDAVCQEPTCEDGVKNGSETDVDCGASCDFCAVGRECAQDRDCISGNCPLNGDEPQVCAACEGQSDCDLLVPDLFCANTGDCQGRLGLGDACQFDIQCLESDCADGDGICCDSECDGGCESCSASKTGGTEGECANILADTDPDNECSLTVGGCVGDTCNGAGECNFAAAGATCRPAVSLCDQPEVCAGGTFTCPTDAFTTLGVLCGAARVSECNGPDICDGNGSCIENFDDTTTTCGDTSNTDCTNPDTCDGAGTCLSNHAGLGTSCGNTSTTDCSNPDTCDGAGTCLSNHRSNGTSCGDTSTTECSNPDTCLNGSCQNNHRSNGTGCGSSATTECSNPDTCFNGSCRTNHRTDGTACGDANATACDLRDVCASGVCDDNLAALGTLCGAAADECAGAERCDGAGACAVSSFAPAGTSCGNTSSSDCNSPDTCDGAGACLDNLASNGDSCGSSANTTCTNPDTCNSSGVCLANHASTTVNCGTTCGSDGSGGFEREVSQCNGNGGCAVSSTTSCGNFRCSGTACRTSCLGVTNNGSESTYCIDGTHCGTCGTSSCTGTGCMDDQFDFTDDVLPILTTRNCLGCHPSYANASGLVGVARAASAPYRCNGTLYPLLVSAGDADSSCLIHLLERSSDIMPQGGPALPASEINTIRRWIMEGAND